MCTSQQQACVKEEEVQIELTFTVSADTNSSLVDIANGRQLKRCPTGSFASSSCYNQAYHTLTI